MLKCTVLQLLIAEASDITWEFRKGFLGDLNSEGCI